MHGARRILRGHRVHEAHKIGRGPRGAALGHDAPAVDLKRAEQGLRPMARVFELPAPPAARDGRAIREAALQGLHARLLVNREHDCVARGCKYNAVIALTFSRNWGSGLCTQP